MFSKLLLALPCLFLISCVTTTRYVDVKVPTGSRAAGNAGGKFEITQVADARTFEVAPELPSTPSIARETKAGTSRERIVGRQRGSYGKAYANILLTDGQAMPERVRALMTEGLERRGHAVVSGGIPLQVEVKQFWAWMNPGVWSISLEGKIECLVRMPGGRQITVLGHAENPCQGATEKNWNQAYEYTVEDFLKNLETQLDQAGY